MIKRGFPGAIGETPLIRVPSLSEMTGCEILGKAEFLNPGGSVKDRAAKFMIEDAVAKGILKRGGLVVEGTAGNTGIGLALMCNALGFACSLVVPSNQSQEKIDLLRALGADVELVPPAPFKDPNNYFHVARRKAEENPGSFWANQFENTANSDAHFKTTGPEIWRQSSGKVDAVILAAGTGGTIGGVSAFIKERSPKTQVWLIDPPGSGLWSWIKKGVIASEGSSITEGIGIMRLTENFKRARIDDAVRGSDEEVVAMAHHVLRRDGLFVGTSAALNLVGAVRMARKLGPGKVVVTVLCDGGGRYQSRLFNSEWLRQSGFSAAAEAGARGGFDFSLGAS